MPRKTPTAVAPANTNTGQISVDVLGKGQETITVDKGQTVADLKKLLALDSDVQASTKDGRTLSDTDKVLEVGAIDFSPNVAGGR